jgi:hypothetical protein
LCELSPQRFGLHEVREGTFAVDLDDRQPLSVASPQLRVAGDVDLLELESMLGTRCSEHTLCSCTEVAPGRVVEDDAGYG